MKSISKSNFREIINGKSRFISIMAIVAIGVGFFAGVKASEPDMRLSADTYFNQQNLMDMRLVSTIGFDNDDVSLLMSQSGGSVFPGYHVDCVLEQDNADTVVRTYSYGRYQVNEVIVTDGRLPQASDECAIDVNIMKNNIHLGSVITLKSGDDSDISKALNRTEYTVVGIVQSPMYVSGAEYGSTTIGSGSIGGAVFVNEDCFAYPRYTDVFMTFGFLREYSTYSDEYSQSVEDIKTRIDNIADNRRSEITGQAAGQASDAVDELELAYNIAKSSVDTQSAQLNKLKDEIKTDDDTYALDELKLNQSVSTLNTDVNKLFAVTGKSFDSITASLKTLQKAQTEYQTGLFEYESALASADAKRELIESALEKYKGKKEDFLEDSVVSGKIADYEKQIEEIKTALDDLAAKKETFDKTKTELDKKWSQFSSQYAAELMGTGEYKEIASDAVAEYIKSFVNLTVLKAKLEIKKGVHSAACEAFDKQKPEAESQMSELSGKMSKASQSLDSLVSPEWYCFTREDNPGYSEYGENAQRIGNISKIFPVFFLLVAALVCLTTMTRMVNEQRTQIGTLKALGYNNGVIVRKYMAYALSATLIGAVLGLVIGFKLFPTVIITSYRILYRIPVIEAPFIWNIAIASTAAALICIGLTVFFSCKNELKRMPSQLMRPKTPPKGKRILLERVHFIWNHMNFSRKVSTRNIFRYKKRMLMTVIGIAGCTALVLTGFGLRDSISDIVSLQYGKICKYDLIVSVGDSPKEDTYEHIYDELHRANGGTVLKAMQKSFTAENNDKSMDAVVFVPENMSAVGDYITFCERGSDDVYTLDNSGAIVTEKLANQLGLSVGDSISVTGNEGMIYTFPIAEITENYVHNYVYVSPTLYENTTLENPSYNVVLCKYGDYENGDTSALVENILSSGDVFGVSVSDNVKNSFSDMIGVLDLVVMVLIISAGALAFVVLFNLTNININERIREIATLKVLGFYNKEVSGYVFRENIVLTVMGIIAGLPLGRLLAKFVIETAEIDMVMFGRSVYLPSYVYAAVITVVFSLIVSLVMHRRLKKISMIDSLKSVE